MDWSNESYVRLYVRDSTTWRRLGWDGQCVLMALLRKVDRAGTLDLSGLEPWEAVMLHVGCPEEVARKGVDKLVTTNTVTIRDDRITLPSFIEAQECVKSDRLRARESRERRALGRPEPTPEPPPSRNVTRESHDATDPSRETDSSHAESRGVTPRHSVLCSATPSSAVLTQTLSRERARGVDEPPIGENPAEPEREPNEPDPEAGDPPPFAGTSSAHVQEVLDAFRAEFFAADAGTMPRLWGKALDAVVEHCRDVARDRKVPLGEAARQVCKAAEPGTKSWPHDVARVDPYAPRAGPRPANANGRRSPARGTTAKDFENDLSFEQSMRIVRGEAT